MSKYVPITKSFAKDIEAAVGDERIEAIVIGEYGWGTYDDEKSANVTQNKVLTWEEARPMLDYKYHDGFGSPECHAITAWTANHVFFVSEYDGATHVCKVPRNPIDHTPYMPGG